MLTAEQVAARKGKMTSSIVAGALGLNPNMTPLDALMRVTGKLPPTETTKAMERGNLLERLVLEYPCEELMLDLRPAPFRQHPRHAWAGDSADAVYVGPSMSANSSDAAAVSPSVIRYIGEGKTVSGGVAKHYGEEGTDDIHPGALVQSHWHLIHWPEVDTCLVPVLVGGYKFEFRLYYVRRDEEFEGALLEDAARWHRDYVVADKAPPATDPRDLDNLLMLHPVPTAGLAEPTSEIEDLAIEKEAARLDKVEAETREKTAKMRLIELIGDHEGVRGDGWVISYGATHYRPKVDYKAIVESLNVPDNVIAQYTYTPPASRSLRVKIKDIK